MYPAGEELAEYLQEQRILKKVLGEHTVAYTHTHIYIQICSHAQYKQIHSVHSVADMLYTQSATSLKPLTRSEYAVRGKRAN